MSELMNAAPSGREFRWSLLATVSVLALWAAGDMGSDALAYSSEDRPTVWIELGAQFERVDAGEEQFAPPFILATPRPSPETVSPLDVGHAPRHSIGGEGKISFEPVDSDLVFSIGVRYGRSNSQKHLRQQSYPTQPTGFTCTTGCIPKYQRALQFMDTTAKHSESHFVLDFQAGKDLGIGLFSGRTSSIISLGVRVAQFGSKSNVAFKSDPDAKVEIKYSGGNKFRVGATYHSNQGTSAASRSFRGIGPSISLSASTPIAGSREDGQIAIDWGANAAVLFGRQKAKVHHQATAQYHQGKYYISSQPNYRTTQYRHSTDHVRSRSVVVPNVGGFAGLTFGYSAAKVSFGYRADFFFGAMDGGLDTRKAENRSFYGPFATIGVGL